MTNDQLLYGVVARRLGVIADAALLEAMEAWAGDRTRPLGLVLLERRAISPEDHARVEAELRRIAEGASASAASAPAGGFTAKTATVRQFRYAAGAPMAKSAQAPRPSTYRQVKPGGEISEGQRAAWEQKVKAEFEKLSGEARAKACAELKSAYPSTPAIQSLDCNKADWTAVAKAIGAAGARIVEAVLGDQHRVLPVSTLSDFPGVGEVCMSQPAIVGRKGIVQRVEVPLSASERAALTASARSIRETAVKFGAA